MTVECKTKYAAEKYFINWAKKEANKQEVLNNYNRIFKPNPKQWKIFHNSEESEAYVLGVLLMEPTQFSAVSGILVSPEPFYVS